MRNCVFCNKSIEDHVNYCSWECHIAEAKANNGKVVTPNNLPITCIQHDYSMLEHEHAAHPDYKFPVKVEYRGPKVEDLPDWDMSYKPETHALIYTDGSIVVTLYEHTYGVFYLNDGSSMRDKHWYKEWFLTQESIDEIKRRST